MRRIQIPLPYGLILLLSGCSLPGQRADVPLGEWHGRGFFVYDVRPPAEQTETQPAAPTRLCRTYPTRLSIRPLPGGAREGFELDIVSERGPLPDLGDRTHLMAALIEAERISASATLYRMPDWKFNPDADAVLDLEREEAPMAASCIRSGGSTILRIRYDEDFTDTFRFRGARLEKHGMLHTDDGLIHWSETLYRRK